MSVRRLRPLVPHAATDGGSFVTDRISVRARDVPEVSVVP